MFHIIFPETYLIQIHSIFGGLSGSSHRQLLGEVLVLHGGLGDGTWGLNDLEQLKRPMQVARSIDVAFGKDF